MADILEINDIVDDRYKIVSLLGEGGMALVYKANDLITSKDVALKIMRPETAIDKTNLSRFEREARAAASLNHQNIVRVNNLGTYKGYPYMVNELITGQTLRQILDIRGKFSIIESLDIMEQLCRAISYAHQHGCIQGKTGPVLRRLEHAAGQGQLSTSAFIPYRMPHHTIRKGTLCARGT